MWAAALPGVLYAVYYLHGFDDWAGYIEFRSCAGTEYLGAGAGMLAGLADHRARNRMRSSVWGVPAMLALGVSIPFLKPMLRPLDLDQLTERWEAAVCLQGTASTCGPASAATVARHLGHPISERELAAAAHTSASGTESWYLARALRVRGLQVLIRTREPGPDRVQLPAIAGVRNRLTGAGHFVAVIERQAGRWHVADPLHGGAWYADADLRSSFDFTGFFMEITIATPPP